MKQMFCLLLVCLSFVGHSQSNENVFIHLDKPAYVAGETMWFKAYLIGDSVFSSNFYVSLVDEQGEVIKTKHLPVIDGTVAGDFTLNSKLKTGTYFLCAFVNSTDQKNLKSVRELPIFNSHPETFIKSKEILMDIFPSGGRIVNNLPNLLAYKIRDAYGNVPAITGILKDNTGSEIATLNPVHQGIGLFRFTPEKNKQYYIEFDLPDGEKKTFQLPNADGVSTITVWDQAAEKYFNVELNEDGKRLRDLKIVGISRNTVLFEQQISAREAGGKIPVKQLPSGITQLQLLSGDRIIADRMIFVNNEEYILPVTLQEGQLNITSKGWNEIHVLLPDSAWGNFSVAVTDPDQQIITDDHHKLTRSHLLAGIKTKPWLTDDILAAKTPAARAIMDLLMLTNRFPNQHESSLQETGYISLTGTAFDPYNKKPLKSGSLTFFLRTRDSSMMVMNALIDDKGRFELNNLLFEDTADVNYALSGKRNFPVGLKLDTVARSDQKKVMLDKYQHTLFDFSKYDSKTDQVKLLRSIFETTSADEMLTEVVVSSRIKTKKQQVNDRYSRGLFAATNMAKVIDLINEPPIGGGNIFEYIQTRFPGVRVETRDRINYTLYTNRSMSLMGGLVPIKLYLNENEAESDMISTLPIREIALVKYFPPGYIMLPGIGISGVLAVYTKKVEDSGVDGFTSVGKFKLAGYNRSAFFPKADEGSPTKEHQVTQHWEPDILLDGTSNKYLIRFYNTMERKRLKVVFQGVAGDGRVVYLERILE